MRIIDEDEKNEDLQDRKAKKEQDDVLNKAKKNAKSNFRMILVKALAASLPFLLPIIIVAVIVASIVAAFSTWLHDSGGSTTSESAKNATMDETVAITREGSDDDSDDSDISLAVAIEASENGEYHITIDKDVTDEDIYVKRYVQSIKAGYYNAPAEMEEALKSFLGDLTIYEVTDEELEEAKETIAGWFGISEWEDVEPYLIRLLSAEIASTYPKIDDDDYYNSLEKDDVGNYIDENDDYVVQGMVEIQRTIVKIELDDDGVPTGELIEETPEKMKYLPLESFKELVEAANRMEEVPDPSYYFSFEINDDGTPILYYTNKVESYTTWERDGRVTGNGSAEYEIIEYDYSNVVEAFCMPYTFVFSLMQRTTLPEYVNAVIDLLMEDSEAVLMLKDDITYTKTVTTEEYVKRTTIYTSEERELTEEEKEELKAGMEDGGESINDNYLTTTEWVPNYSYDVTTTVTTTKTWENTAEVYIDSANTWMVVVASTTYYDDPVIVNPEGETITQNYSYTDLTYETISTSGTYYDSNIGTTKKETAYSNQALSSTTDTDIYSFKLHVSTVSVPVTDKFLGLWRNAYGVYTGIDDGYSSEARKERNKYVSKGSGGILVAYQIPDTESEDQMETAVDDVIDTAGNDIDDLLWLLSLHEDTEHVTEFVMYCFNEYYRDEHEDYTGDYYDVDIDSILDLYDSNNWTSNNDLNLSGDLEALIENIITVATNDVDYNYKYYGFRPEGEYCLKWVRQVYTAARSRVYWCN